MQRVGAAAGQRGCSLSKENTPFGTPRERQGGFPLDPAHWQFVARRAAQPAESGAVYMASPWIFCESLRLATAPYYREARVTIAWRQTACEIAALLRSPHCGDWQ